MSSSDIGIDNIVIQVSLTITQKEAWSEGTILGAASATSQGTFSLKKAGEELCKLAGRSTTDVLDQLELRQQRDQQTKEVEA